ncbi:uncharacterized protein LOC112087462 [Eutrema salsugineum]|uniref:uncharacterized protein LOC112087462 n=1 Tax=Eutrema salsugineum TaxID=72664 RepID=UPI000CED0679|nr:uncharacterized protein LOC112087462 [Eutrema salsugineum]
MPRYCTLEYLSPTKPDSRIFIKVLRVWEHFNYRNQRQELHLILGDENGYKIEASIDQDLIPSLGPKVKEREWNYVKFFSVVNAFGSFRNTINYHFINMNADTVVDKTFQVNPKYMIDFMPCDVIIRGNFPTEYSIDLIGVIIYVDDELSTDIDDPYEMIMLIRDMNYVDMDITLIGKTALNFWKKWEDIGTNETILTLRMFRLTYDSEERYRIRNAGDHSELLFNPHIKEVSDYLN